MIFTLTQVEVVERCRVHFDTEPYVRFLGRDDQW